MIEIFDNIRQLYKFQTPAGALHPYVEFFSETSLDETHRLIQSETFTVKLFPSYTPTIWINLGTPYLLANGRKQLHIDEQTDILLLRNEIVERKNLPSDNIFTVKFHPGGFETIFGISQTRIGSNVVPLQDIIPAGMVRKLRNAASMADRINLFESLFHEKLEVQQKKDNYYLQCIHRTIDAFAGSGMEAGNGELARQLYLTDKSLYRYFTKIIGTSPKKYLGITRARTALTGYTKNAASFSPHDYGYYDRSHFYKDVLNFTGQHFSSYLHR
ncbi:helix-turn-helix domain-containing protein [Chitinophaga sp. 212800010-3]|uniref:helix-turn-helix domain-containing protein n=1 Tax=unclassified Chitinophaga TaxID=2619133 RepID=UPI002DF1A08C|nr:HTH araC/xylS-type domain-containing protein [Chitinophaga sp. 212800010-3]